MNTKSLVILLCVVATMVFAKPTKEKYEEGFARRVAKHHSKPRSYAIGLNDYFVGKTLGHIQKLMGTKMEYKTTLKASRHGHGHATPTPTPQPANGLPDSFDARTQWPNCPSISTIKDQANCGSCWAVAAAQIASDRICIGSNGALIPTISAEYLLSCCKTTKSPSSGSSEQCGQGCDGGYPNAAMDYWVENGVCTGGDYNSNVGCQPYAFKPCPDDGCTTDAKTPKCATTCRKGYSVTTPSKDLHKATSSYQVPNDEASIRNELYQNGPVEAAFTVYQDFMDYTSGVYQWDGESEEMGGHAVKILGWGTDADSGLDYWLVANSWNTNWGENGYFKIARGTNECGIEDGVVAGKASS